MTLMEIMVALAITSLVMVAMYSVLNATLRARDQLENEARVARVGPEILDVIQSDLKRLWLMNIKDDLVFKGEERTINGEHADSILFITTVDSSTSRRIDEREVVSDLCESGYRLRRNPQLPDVMELYRRQSFHVDEEPLEDGGYELLHDRVVSFKLRYLEEFDEYAERLSEWDAEERHALPAAVEIDLRLEVVPRTIELSEGSDRTISYRRVIPLLPDSDLCMRVRPLVPTFSAANLPGGGAGAGSGQDNDDLAEQLENGGEEGGGGSGSGGDPGFPFPGGGGGGGGNPFPGLFDTPGGG